MKFFGSWQKKSVESDEKAAFDGPPPLPGATKGSHTEIGQGRKILVVDDNQPVLKAFELKFKSLGFGVLSATEGASAVTIARQQRPDVIILDINFPPDVGSSGLQWDGFNIMQWLKRFQEAANIPVIIITSGDPTKLKDRALAAGAVAFFQKPINNEEFLLNLRRVLGQVSATKPVSVI